jgi:hypothetical protein
MRIYYTFPGFYFVQDSHDVKRQRINFEMIDMAFSGHLAESGKPMLPSFGRYIQIPPNVRYDVTVEKSKPVFFDDVTISPAQEKLRDVAEKHDFEYNSRFYAKDALYPRAIVRVSGPFNFGRYQSILLHVIPMQYNPISRRLIG